MLWSAGSYSNSADNETPLAAAFNRAAIL